MKKKVAIPIWDKRVSPVMDTANHLLIVEIIDGREAARKTVDIPRTNISNLATFIADLDIDDLICAAISHQFEQLLFASGIKIRSWYQGEIEDLIVAYSRGVLQSDNFISPGRGRRRRHGSPGRRRPGRAELRSKET